MTDLETIHLNKNIMKKEKYYLFVDFIRNNIFLSGMTDTNCRYLPNTAYG